jgi:hypothetical protein
MKKGGSTLSLSLTLLYGTLKHAVSHAGEAAPF